MALLCNLRSRLSKLFEVETADNGLLALEKVLSKPLCYYEAILMDINMPIMDGYEAAHRIK
jgi:CheY-like chemotaxis protein